MSIHHQNMQYLCSATEAWIRQHLSILGIAEFGCNFLDLKQNTFLPLGSNYQQYCIFMNNQLHLNMAARITSGFRPWDASEALLQIKQAHCQVQVQPQSGLEPSQPTLYAMDWTIKTDVGFELFCIIGHRPLQPQDITTLQYWMQAFSKAGAEIKQAKPKALLELENRQALLQKFVESG